MIILLRRSHIRAKSLAESNKGCTIDRKPCNKIALLPIRWNYLINSKTLPRRLRVWWRHSIKANRSILLSLFLVESAFGVQPHRSISHFASANGLCTIRYNLTSKTVDSFRPHLADYWDIGVLTPNLIEKAGFNLTIKGSTADLAIIPISHSGYVNGTPIIRIEQAVGKLKAISYIWTPMILDFKVMLMVVHIPGAVNLGIEISSVNAFATALTTELTPIRMAQFEGDDCWIGQAILYHSDLTLETLDKLKQELAKAKPKLLLEAEQRWWNHWHRLGKAPADIIDKKYEVLLQSAAFIKAAQSREPGSGKGQIVNTLSSAQDQSAYSRDMAYSIVALIRMGHFPEAKSALQFLLNGKGRQYIAYPFEDKDWGVGKPYAISLSHYYGMGDERADISSDAPLLYFDGLGLFLWAAGEFVKRGSDIAFIKSNWPQIEKYVIEPLLSSFDQTGLVRRDSGLWNEPLPGEHFAFASLSAFRGLNSAALMARTIGKDEKAKFYTKKASELRESVLSRLTVGSARVLTRSMETKKYPFFLDGSGIEAINWRVVEPSWNSAKSTLKALEAFLRVDDLPRGFALGYGRNREKADENLFISLRAVEAFRIMGHKKRAEQLLQWIVEQASMNGEMIPEYFTTKDADYAGAYPVVGMGAGAFILAVMMD